MIYILILDLLFSFYLVYKFGESRGFNNRFNKTFNHEEKNISVDEQIILAEELLVMLKEVKNKTKKNEQI